MHHARRAFAGPLVVLAILVSQSVLFADPGFGTLRKKKIDLQVRKPALVRLANTSLAFKGKVTNREYTPVLGSLEATLETELVGNEKTLVKKSEADADWVMQMTVTGFSVPQPQSRVQAVKNAPSITYVRWTGTVNVAYQVVDRTGRVHDADNVSSSYDKEFQSNAPSTGGIRIPGLAALGGNAKAEPAPRSAEDVKQILVKQVVALIASNLGNTVQAVEAQVAGGDGSLDRAGDFMTRQLWSRAIEELEKTPAFAKPEDESYRQYSLGLAYEALSYEGKAFNEQRANLFKAQEFYDKALELNRGQKYFVDVVARTRESVARYRALDAMQKEDRQKQPGVVTASNGSAPAKGAGKPLTVNDVIEMQAGNVSEQQIVEVIQGSTMEFALDKDTSIAIAGAKLSVAVQNAMRQQAGLPLLPVAGRTPAARPPAAPKAPAAKPKAAAAPAKTGK